MGYCFQKNGVHLFAVLRCCVSSVQLFCGLGGAFDNGFFLNNS